MARRKLRSASVGWHGQVMTRVSRMSSIWVGALITSTTGWFFTYGAGMIKATLDDIHHASVQVEQLSADFKTLSGTITQMKADATNLDVRIQVLERQRAVRPRVEAPARQPTASVLPPFFPGR